MESPITYRQLPLEGFATIEAMRTFMIPTDHVSETDAEGYELTPEKFINAAQAVVSVNFRESMDNGMIYFESTVVDGVENAHLTMATGRTLDEQARTLTHEMIHVDRGKPAFMLSPIVEEYGSLTIKEFQENYPEVFQKFTEYMKVTSTIKDTEEDIVSVATEKFYAAHPTLAKLALCYMWDRFEVEKNSD